MEIEFRKGTAKDVAEIITFVDAAKVVMDSQGIFQWDEIYPTKEDFAEDERNGYLQVGTIDGKIAVVFVLNQLSDEEYKTGKWAHPEKSYKVIHRLCVNPEFQNMGVGRQTMLYIEGLLRSEGVEAIRLDAFTQNPYSLKLYDKLGFARVGYADWRKGRFYLMEKYL